MEKINNDPQKLFYVDEIDITTVQRYRSKIVSLKDKKNVCTITSVERRKLMTVITSRNACWAYVPALLIFHRKNMALKLMDGTLTGSVWACHTSGLIQGDVFAKQFSHFIRLTKPTVSISIKWPLQLDSKLRYNRHSA